MSSSRREPSQRKAARLRYLASAHDPAPEPPPASVAFAAAGAASLIECARALYEGAVVPVREIARLVGVGERRIYRYARRLGWAARVRRLKPVAHGRAKLPLAQVRTLYEASRPTVGEIAELAGVTDVTVNNHARKFCWRRRARWLARGGGGRFVGRDDVGLPHPQGLLALDPDGAQEAAERCARAGEIAHDAAAAVEAEALARAARRAAERAAGMAGRDADAALRAFERLNASLVALAKIRVAFGDAGEGQRTQLAARLERAIFAQIERLLTRGTVVRTP